MKTFSQLREASVDRSKRNPTRDFLRKYPVSDAEMAKPITYYSLVHKATNKVLSTHRDLESAKDEHRGMDQGERSHYRIATSTKAPKSFSMKEDAEGVAEATVDIADIEKKKNISPKDKKTLGKIHDLMARERALQQAKTPKPVKEDIEDVTEAVSVKKANYSWGKMVTVHHGSDTSYPLHPEHQAAIKKLKPGESTSFTDETNRKVTASREGDQVHLSGRGSNKRTTVAHSHFAEGNERESVFKSEIDEAGPFSYGAKPPRKGSVAYNALMQRKEQDKKRVKEIEAIGTKNHHVGIAKVTKVTKEEIEDVNNLEEGSKSETEGMVSYIHHIIKNHVYPRAGDKETYMKHVAKEMPSIVKSNPKLFRRAHSIAYDRFFHVDKNNNNDYDHTDHSMRQGEMGHRKGMSEAKDEMYKYIDQSGGHQIKGKSGTYVGYTHSATKGKGANILKHNQTKKYYAAGGSSTAFTQKTTLHDTPEAAAKAYHKGNLAESTETPEHHFEKSLDHYQKAKEALGRGDHEKHQYHAAMGDIHRERVSQHLDQAHKKREPTSHIYKMWSHLSNEHQKHVDIRRNKEWEDEKNQSIQRGREFMDRAGEPSDFEMKDGKLHAKYKPKYDYRTGKKL